MAKRIVGDGEREWEEARQKQAQAEMSKKHMGLPMLLWLLFLGGCAAILLIGMSALTVGVVP